MDTAARFWPIFFDQRICPQGSRAERRGVNLFYSEQPDRLPENILSHITVSLSSSLANCIHVFSLESHVDVPYFPVQSERE